MGGKLERGMKCIMLYDKEILQLHFVYSINNMQ